MNFASIGLLYREEQSRNSSYKLPTSDTETLYEHSLSLIPSGNRDNGSAETPFTEKLASPPTN